MFLVVAVLVGPVWPAAVWPAAVELMPFAVVLAVAVQLFFDQQLAVKKILWVEYKQSVDAEQTASLVVVVEMLVVQLARETVGLDSAEAGQLIALLLLLGLIEVVDFWFVLFERLLMIAAVSDFSDRQLYSAFSHPVLVSY